ncbi:hypothetical protein Bca52824_016479 [Brassica carinata]|uniref:Uncharacterized protein n=1 Tax=Brassica carinata TaxID=52824 RepID=A0A8X7W4I6_BRACI|nr:hypothetical protein Bca52824_016479 [Brassica carinata]
MNRRSVLRLERLSPLRNPISSRNFATSTSSISHLFKSVSSSNSPQIILYTFLLVNHNHHDFSTSPSVLTVPHLCNFVVSLFSFNTVLYSFIHNKQCSPGSSYGRDMTENSSTHKWLEFKLQDTARVYHTTKLSSKKKRTKKRLDVVKRIYGPARIDQANGQRTR